MTGAERVRLMRQRRREGIECVLDVPVTWQQVMWLTKNGHLSREVLSLDMPNDERRKVMAQAVAKLIATATQTKAA